MRGYCAILFRSRFRREISAIESVGLCLGAIVLMQLIFALLNGQLSHEPFILFAFGWMVVDGEVRRGRRLGTHPKLTDKAIELIKSKDNLKVYQEIYQTRSFRKKLLDGSRGEDDHDSARNNFPRYYNHFWNGMSRQRGGLPWHWYYTFHYDLDFPRPPNDRFPSAIAWTEDPLSFHRDQNHRLPIPLSGYPRNWRGAIEAYGYTTTEKDTAYWRLGHTLHLLEDMAEPDHARNEPHGGSSLGVSAFNNIGFERLINDYFTDIDDPQFGMGIKIQRRRTLQLHFRDMTRRSRKERGNERVAPESARSPLGCSFTGGIFREIGINDTAEHEVYFQIARNVLPVAIAHVAGVLQLFYEIVAFPPYVKQIEIKQGSIQYTASWEDKVENGTLVRRDYTKNAPTSPFSSALPIDLKIDFGPATTRIKPNSLKIQVSGQNLTLQNSQFNADHNHWEGRITANQIELPADRNEDHVTLEIYAEDELQHYNVEENKLDPNPRTPAKIINSEPRTGRYQWGAHEKTSKEGEQTAGALKAVYGYDTNHYILVRRPIRVMGRYSK
jgi:hypothetical protein